jgi:heme/copper-type cytochrome/quinol oxidase subunit 2
MRIPPRALLALLALGMIVAASGDALACPNCKDAVADQSSRGFGYSIYIMLGSLFGLVGGITCLIVRTARRAAAAEGRGDSEASV